MKRWRSGKFSITPRSLVQFANQLTDPNNKNLLIHNNVEMSCRIINSSNSETHMMLYDEKFIRKEFGNVEQILIDGTFKTTPRLRGVYQFLTVIGITQNHVSHLLSFFYYYFYFNYINKIPYELYLLVVL